MKVHIVVPCYNRPDLLDGCLASLADQGADTVYVTDDHSDDPGRSGTARWLTPPPASERWFYCFRSERVGTLRNIVEAIRDQSMDPDDVILLVDGDDQLLPGAVDTIRAIYDSDTQVSYGSYRCASGAEGPRCDAYPPEVLASGTVRAWTHANQFLVNHPISFRRRIFDAIPDSYYMMDGRWMRHSYDAVLMMAAIELAGTRVHWEPTVSYVYEDRRPDSVALAHQEEAHAEGQHVYGQVPLSPLEVNA